MIEQLSNAGIQRLTAELAQGRLDALLRIGQVRVATVVDVVPQPPRQSSNQPQNTTSQVRQSNEASSSAADNKTSSQSLTYSRPQTTNSSTRLPASSTNSPLQNSSQSSSTSSSNSSVLNSPTRGHTANSAAVNESASNQAYRAKINIEGKLLDIVVPSPLKPGSQITLTRNEQNQLVINTQHNQSTTNNGSPTRALNGNTPASNASTNNPAQRLAMLQPGETSTAKVIQSRPEASTNPVNTTSGNRPVTPPQTAGIPTHQNSNLASQGNTPSASQVTNPTTTAMNTAAGTQSSASPTQNHVTTVNIKGTLVELLTPRPIPTGTELKISLDKSGQVQVQLPAPARLAADQALRDHLPNQQPLSQLLNLLQDPALSQQISRSQPMLTGLLQLLMGRSLTAPQQTDAQQVRQSMNDSGTQMENKASRQDTQGLRQDSKALLLQLQNRLGQLSQSLPQNAGQRITEMTQQAISRVLVNQLTSLSQQVTETEGDRTRTLVTDIPVSWQQQTENLRIRITQRQTSGDNESGPMETRWQVQLQFNMPEMPPMQAELTLVGEQISVLFYGNDETQRLVNPHLETLQSALESSGLEVDLLQVRKQPMEIDKPIKTAAPLVDIKT